jgi:hypothetical protein
MEYSIVGRVVIDASRPHVTDAEIIASNHHLCRPRQRFVRVESVPLGRSSNSHCYRGLRRSS